MSNRLWMKANVTIHSDTPDSECIMPRIEPSRATSRARTTIRLLMFVVLGSTITAPALRAWGPEVHVQTDLWAIQCLPPSMRPFFNTQREVVIAHANDPDLWEKKDKYELMRHYIFLDRYGEFPYLKLPHSFKDAVRRYGAGRVAHSGVLPWQIGTYSLRLTNDFRSQNWKQATLDAAALAFYVADAHDPLHTTQNYDGQRTDQIGLDDRFGSELFRRYRNFFLFERRAASQISDPTRYAFRIVLKSHTSVDRILLADRRSREGLSGYNHEYYDRFYSRVGTMAMRELSEAAHDAASYWYTAWRNAGEPALPKP